VCHSEKRSDEESAFGFPVLVERVQKKAQSRCFTSFSMTQQQTPSTWKDSVFLSELCGLCVSYSDFGCGSVALFLCGEFVVFLLRALG